MAVQTKNTWEILYSNLQKRAQESNDSLKTLDTLHKAAQSMTDVEFGGHVRELAQQAGLETTNLGDLISEASAWRAKNFPLQDASLEENSSTQSSSRETSWSDFFSRKNERGGGFSEEKDPDMHAFIKNRQKAELLEKFNELAENPEKRDALLNDLLDRFEYNALFNDYHEKFRASIQQLPSFQKLSAKQREDLLEQFEKHHEALAPERDALEREADERNATNKDKKRQGLKKEIEKLLVKTDKKSSQESFSLLISDRQNMHDDLLKQRYRGKDPLWEPEEFSLILQELHYFPRQFVASMLLPTPSITITPPVEDDDSFPDENSNQTGGRTTRKKTSNRTRAIAKNIGKNLRGRFQKKAAEEVAKVLVKKSALRTALPYIIIAAVILILIISLIIVVITVFGGKGSSSDSGTQATLPPACSPSTECLANLKSFGVNLTGDLSDNGDPNGKAKYVYQTIELLTQSPSQFGKLLGLPTKPVTITIPSMGCVGHADYGGIRLLWCGDNAASQFMMAHELGHVLAFRNLFLFTAFYSAFAWRSAPLNTFNCLHDYDAYGGRGPYAAECWADMVGEYVVYKQWRDAVGGGRRSRGLYPPGPVNYPDFPSVAGGFYYNFAKQNIFGGLEY